MEMKRLILEYLYNNTLKYDDFWVPLVHFYELHPSIQKNNSNFSFYLNQLEKEKHIGIRNIGDDERFIFLKIKGILFYEETYFQLEKQRPLKKLILKILRTITAIEEGRSLRNISIKEFLERLNLEFKIENRTKIYWLIHLIQGEQIESNSAGYISSKDPLEKEQGIIRFRQDPPHLLTDQGRELLAKSVAPRLFLPGSWSCISHLNKEELEALRIVIAFFEEYATQIRELAKKKFIHFKNFKIFRQSSKYLIIFDDKNVFLLFSSQHIPLTATEYYCWNWQGKQNSLNFYFHEARINLNFENSNAIALPSEILTLEYNEAKKIIEQLAKNNFNIEYEEIMKGEKVNLLKKDEILWFFDNASEDDFTDLFFAPLSRTMGFENVKVKGHKTKPMEFGQDIKLMKYKLPTNHYLYFVAQIKKGDISSSPKDSDKNISYILDQARQAFNKEIFDEDIGTKTRPNHVFLVSSGIINPYASTFLEEQIEIKNRQLLLIDRNRLFELYNKFGLIESEHIALEDYIEKNKQT